MIYVIELEPGCYRANWAGDPGRTHDINCAKTYHSTTSANSALQRAKKYRKFEAAKIVPVMIVPASFVTAH